MDVGTAKIEIIPDTSHFERLLRDELAGVLVRIANDIQQRQLDTLTGTVVRCETCGGSGLLPEDGDAIR